MPSGEVACDRIDGKDTKYQPKDITEETSIKTTYRLENLSNTAISSEEEEVEMLAQAMDELDLGRVPLPKMVWTSAKYKPSQVAQFISLMQNTNTKHPKAAREAGISHAIAYKFDKEWIDNGGAVLPGYKVASEIKRKGYNVKITEEHSQFIENYIEECPTCIVKDVTEHVCAIFEGSSINESTVYRHITEKLEFTLTRTQPRLAARNTDGIQSSLQERMKIEQVNSFSYTLSYITHYNLSNQSYEVHQV
ncbi:hypothetical protein G6F46_000647 [Rhizopus delemar]|nr:hypothetical protein G6F36_012225 [Rhizopus arrhizus]KAG1446597.1 hypothetical protein G6F55_011481 [Rhizopus delemar]KAG1489195.1 hypothetical protein G6F54_011610 [Rhizopus delemar]KAG1513050.1 hypothetical protein G6F52_010260 [Rhizopus delemar]KAG1514873.1 hypothetical protein G6F53_003341 [Rhizopus delemar]